MKLPYPDQYYVCLEKDLTSWNRFQNPIGKWVKAPDWRPARDIDCGFGLHVVKGHPLFALDFVRREKPVFARVAVSRPVVPASKNRPGNPKKKYRVQKRKVTKVLTRHDPEFNVKTLLEISCGNASPKVREEARVLLGRWGKRQDFEEAALTGRTSRLQLVALGYLCARFSGDVLMQLALSDSSPAVRGRAASLLTSERFQDTLVRIALEDKNPSVRYAAVRKLPVNACAHVLEQIFHRDSSSKVRQAALEKLPLARHETLFIELATKKGNSRERIIAIYKLSPRRHRKILEQIRGWESNVYYGSSAQIAAGQRLRGW